jgi:hypothetical protein
MAYQFRVGNGQWFAQDRFNTFIDQAVRPIFPGRNATDTATVTMQVVGQVNQTLAITMQCKDFYITGFQNRPIPKNLINYNESNVKLNQKAVTAAFTDAMNFNGQNLQEDTVKVMAFMFCEAARFANINYVATRIMGSMEVTYNWSQFRNICRNWSVISQNAIASGELPQGTVQNADGNLITPVEPDMVRNYAAAQKAKGVYFPLPGNAGF